MDPFSGIAGRIITSVGFSAIVATASATTSVTKNIYDIILGINKNSSLNDIQVVNSINEMDIATTTTIIDSNLKVLEVDKITARPVTECITSLNKIIIRIRDELRDIKRKLTYNNSLSRFTKQFRCYDLSCNLVKLRISNNILHNRFKLLLESLEINKNGLYTEISTEEDKKIENNVNLENDQIELEYTQLT
jgi:hypothetical protein